jgi:hypothetical protein
MKLRTITRGQIVAEIMKTDRSDRDIGKRFRVSNRTVSQLRKRLEEQGVILPRLPSTHPIEACLYKVCTSALKPTPENDLLYDPVREDDPNFLALLEDIRQKEIESPGNGLQHPIGISRDGYIFDGHRRFAAVKKLGWKKVTVRIRPDISYTVNRERFLELLVSCNKGRMKTTAEQVREGIAGMENNAWQRVCEYRTLKSQVDGVEAIQLYGEKRRSEIREKIGLKNAIIEVVNANRSYWPLSDRKVFYLLLNIEGLLRNDRRKTPFENSEECWNDVTDMVTRMRIDEIIPFDCIDDETRPVITWDTHLSVGTFVDRQLENLFSGYWRDLQQSQPNWIELLVEKNTIARALKSIAAKYAVPMTSGRGYSSLPPRKKMIDRFLASGREKLVLIVDSDFDPEGEDIPNAFGVSLRDDFGLPQEKLVIYKAALTHSQVQTLQLHEGQLAKEDSSRYERFVAKYGKRCWELESIPTETLREINETAIRNVLDTPAFEEELAREKREKLQLNEYRRDIKRLISQQFSRDDLDDEDDD